METHKAQFFSVKTSKGAVMDPVAQIDVAMRAPLVHKGIMAVAHHHKINPLGKTLFGKRLVIAFITQVV